MNKNWIIAYVALGLVIFTLILPLMGEPKRYSDSAVTANPLRDREGTVDRVDLVETAAGWAAGTLDNAEVKGDRLQLAGGNTDDFPRTGRWTGPEVVTPFGFTEFLPSWNVQTPADTGVLIEYRLRDRRTGKWSPWLYFGQWGRTTKSLRYFDWKWENGKVDTDVAVLKEPADAYQARVTFQSFNLATPVPSLSRLAACYSGDGPDSLATHERLPEADTSWQRDIPVPYLAQGDAPKALAKQICSPTSTAMVMSYWAKQPVDVVDNAMRILDPVYNIFGNWSRAAQRASELGLKTHLRRFRSWDDVKPYIARGVPLIISVNWEAGEFPSNPVMKNGTDGHLIVLRGLKVDGGKLKVIANDPATRERGNGVVYDAADVAKVWFGNTGGVAYVIEPAFAPTTKPATQPRR